MEASVVLEATPSTCTGWDREVQVRFRRLYSFGHGHEFFLGLCVIDPCTNAYLSSNQGKGTFEYANLDLDRLERSSSFVRISRLTLLLPWERSDVSTLLPMWIAPNLITLAGLLCQVTATLLMLYYVPDLHGRAPAWVYLFNSISVFAYQTLDGVDGKQARRTGSSSPLGQLFDHGCDALSVPLLMICVAGALNLGTGVRPMFALVLVMLPWVVGNWQEYHTGVLNVGNGWIGVTEGQFGLMIVHFVSAVYGPSFWQNPVDLWGLLPTPFALVDVMMAVFMVVSLIGSAIEILKILMNKCPLEKADVGNKDVDKVSAIGHLLPFISIILLGLLWSANESSDIHPFLLMSSVGSLFAWNALELVVSHCAKEPFLPSYWPHVLLGACAVNSCFLRFHPEMVGGLVMGLMIFFYLRFVFGVVNQLTGYLNIKCLSIT